MEFVPELQELLKRRLEATTTDEKVRENVRGKIGKFKDKPHIQAMLDLFLPVDHHYDETTTASHEDEMLIQRRSKSMSATEFQACLDKVPSKIKEIYESIKSTVSLNKFNETPAIDSSKLFTQCIIELWQAQEVFSRTRIM